MPKKIGVLASAMSETNETIMVYAVPELRYASCTIAIVNCGEQASIVSLAICPDSGAPLTSEWIEHDLPLDPGEGVERSGVMLGEFNSVWLRADSASFAINIIGIEQDTE